MSGEDAVLVVEAVCDKIGVAVEDMSALMPGLVRYEIIDDFIGVGFACLYMAIVVALLLIQVHRHKRYNTDPDYNPSDWALFVPDAVCAVMAVVGIFLVLMAVCCVSDIIGWFVTPETKFISWFLRLLS